MDIIIDTREQKPLRFTGHWTTRRKLNEGDYNIEELIPYIVIERKSLQDLYHSITTEHERFKDELVRSKLSGRVFYIFLEGTLEQFYSLEWSKQELKTKSETLRKIISTMEERHKIIIVECKDRREMSKLIIQTLDMNKKLYGV